MKQTIILKANRLNADNAIGPIGNLPRDKAWTVEVTPYAPKHSDSQRNYLWGPVYQKLMDTIGADIGFINKEELHEFLCCEAFGTRAIEMDGRTMIKPVHGTSGFNKQQYSDYLMFVGKWAAEHGVYIEEPGEIDEATG